MKLFCSILKMLARPVKGLGICALVLFLGATERPKALPLPRPAANPSISYYLDTVSASPRVVNLLYELPSMRPPEVAPRPRVIRMEVTAYCPCKKCCGPEAQGVTASGLHVSHNEGKFVAADTDLLPFNTKLVIPGYDISPVPVIDRGGAIKGHRLDVFFPTHEQALEWGRQWLDIMIAE